MSPSRPHTQPRATRKVRAQSLLCRLEGLDELRVHRPSPATPALGAGGRRVLAGTPLTPEIFHRVLGGAGLAALLLLSLLALCVLSALQEDSCGSHHQALGQLRPSLLLLAGWPQAWVTEADLIGLQGALPRATTPTHPDAELQPLLS